MFGPYRLTILEQFLPSLSLKPETLSNALECRPFKYTPCPEPCEILEFISCRSHAVQQPICAKRGGPAEQEPGHDHGAVLFQPAPERGVGTLAHGEEVQPKEGHVGEAGLGVRGREKQAGGGEHVQTGSHEGLVLVTQDKGAEPEER